MSRRSYCVGALAVLILCALVLTCISGMFVPAPSKARTSLSVGWIMGQVTDGVNPIDHVYVLYVIGSGSGGPLGSGWTDSTGHYNLTVVGGVPYMVIAFNGSYYSASGSAAPAPGGSATLDLTMIPISPLVADVELTGFVLDGSGNPVLGGNVVGFANDPVNLGQGAPIYGNMTTADPVTGRYTINVIAGSAGGGVGALDFPGYKFTENSTQNPLVSGQTYWFNVTLTNPPSTDDAVISGNVTDAGTSAPLEDVLVNIESHNSWSGQSGYTNYTLTNLTGHYQLNVTNGTSRITFQKSHYSILQMEGVSVGHGSHLTIDATLLAATATVRGNVTDMKTSLPLSGVQVYLTDNLGHYTSATTNSLGEYTLDGFSAPSEWIVAQRTGYTRNVSAISILPGDNLWMDLGLWPLDAWLIGTVSDVISGTPLANVTVNVHSAGFDGSVESNATGVYNITLLSGNDTVEVNQFNYSSYSTRVHVVPGGNVFNIALMPINPPRSTMLYGWVFDSVSGLGIPNAKIQTGLAAPYQGDKQTNTTNSTGFYIAWITPAVVQYVVTAPNHVHAEGLVNATGQVGVLMNFTLAPDNWGPNVTFGESPKMNISWTNPSWVNVTAQEKDPMQLVLTYFMFVNASSGHSDYALVQMFYQGFDPLNQANNNLPFTKTGDHYDISIEWKAEVNGGWLTSGTSQQYLPSYEIRSGPNTYQGLRGVYYNASLGHSQQGTAWFDNVTGGLAFFSFDNFSMPLAFPTDATGMIAPQVSVLRVNNATNSTTWFNGLTEGNWSVVGLHFTYDRTLPSGKYLTEFSCIDFGGGGAGNISFITVDNTPPVANAGPDQTSNVGLTVVFDGTASTDNVGIANYTWTFNNGGTPVTLWGRNPSFSFLSVGVYDVTLTVRDGAGHTSTDTVQVTVSAAIPEFPAVIVPITGMILIMAVVRIRRRKLDE